MVPAGRRQHAFFSSIKTNRSTITHTSTGVATRPTQPPPSAAMRRRQQQKHGRAPFLTIVLLLLVAAAAVQGFVLRPSSPPSSRAAAGAAAAAGAGAARGRRAVVRAAGGGDGETQWGRVRVLETKPVAEGLVHVAVDAGELLASYTTPGQYVQLKPHAPGAKASFFAVASPPAVESGSTKAEFLIKRTEGSAWLCDAKEGEEVDMTPALGKGFQVDSFGDGEGVNFVLLLAAGSGIAPIRAAIESEALGLGKLSRTSKLYYGVQSPSHLAYADKFHAWKERGVEVVPCFSRVPVPMGSPGYWGYVQQGLAGDEIRSPRKTAALLCGMKGMTSLSQHILEEKGVRPERILYNF